VNLQVNNNNLLSLCLVQNKEYSVSDGTFCKIPTRDVQRPSFRGF